MAKKQNTLNLDALLPEKRFVTLDGEQHEVVVETTEMALQIMEVQQDLLAAAEDEENQAPKLRQSISLIQKAVPSIPEDRLRQLPLSALLALMEFLFTQDDLGEEGEGKAAE